VKTGMKRNVLGHVKGCIHYDAQAIPNAGPNSAYVDLFCDCHDNYLPEIGANGSDVIWPKGWTEPEACFWRAWKGILRQGDSAPDICPRCKGTEFVCQNHPTGAWGAPSMQDDGPGVPCPVSSEEAEDAGSPPRSSNVGDPEEWLDKKVGRQWPSASFLTTDSSG
jgi:hypothetical protein